MRRLFLLVFPVLFLTSCKTVDVIKSLYAEEAELVYFTNGNKNLYFIPMHHIGKPGFYEHVKELVTGLKQAGYVVYYERIEMEGTEDSVSRDTYTRKVRKLMGAHFDSTGYAAYMHRRGLFKNLVDQPAYSWMGVDEKDKKADISTQVLIQAYEKKFGEIQLTDADKNIAFHEDYPLSLREPQKQFMDIAIHYRNHYLARSIQESADKKILVIYGALHVEGTFRELRKMDSKWKLKRS